MNKCQYIRGFKPCSGDQLVLQSLAPPLIKHTWIDKGFPDDLQECVLYHAVTALSRIVGLRVEDLWCWYLYILYVSQGQKMNGTSDKNATKMNRRPQILIWGKKMSQHDWNNSTMAFAINMRCKSQLKVLIVAIYCSIKFLHCDWFATHTFCWAYEYNCKSEVFRLTCAPRIQRFCKFYK